MTTTVESINKPPSKTYSRDELQRTMDGWLEANRLAEKHGDWITYLGPFYTDDAVYRWNVGPNEEFVARGRKEIEQIAIGYQMKGFDGWSYPYEKVLIDEKLGELVAFWRQVAPVKRPDGTDYEGTLPSWLPSAFIGPRDMLRLPDGDLLVVDPDADPSGFGTDPADQAGYGALLRVDPETGRVSLVSDGSFFNGTIPDYNGDTMPDPSVFWDP